MENKNITIKEVAQKAGVSMSTVSKAFRNYADISHETRQHILKVAEEIGYKPDNVSIYKANVNKNYRLALLVEDYDAENYMIYEMLIAFKTAASTYGYETIILTTSSDMQKGHDLSNFIQEKQVDGAFIIGLKMTDDYYNQLENINYPCVLYDVPINNDKVACVGVDNIKGSLMAVEHLIKNGHKNIAFINGHKSAVVSYERLDGYYLAFNRNNLPLRKELIIHSDFSYEGGKLAAEELIKENKDITAIFCASDLMAVGAIEALSGLGYSVPKDISVIGFDDINLCQYVSPKLTTIRQDREKIGITAANLLLSIISGQYFGRIVIEPEFILRESTISLLK